TLEGVEAMHVGFETGVPSAMPGATPPAMPGATPPAMPGATPPPMPGAMPPGGVPMAMPGAEPPPGMQAVPDGETLRALTRDDPRVRPTQLTAFFVGTKNRIETLQLKREIDTYQDEAL